jgi:UDP-N-acetyl-D-glucosamine dehydrogenase
LIELATQINSEKPRYVVDKIADVLNQRQKSLNGSTVLVLGVAYKRDIDDIRESPSLDVMSLLNDKGVVVNFADPWVAEVMVGGARFEAVDLTAACVAAADAVALLTDHSGFDYEMIAREAAVVVDTRNAFKGVAGENILRI